MTFKIFLKSQTQRLGKNVLLALAFTAFFSFVVGKFFQSFDEKQKKYALILLTFFVFGPLPDSIFYPLSFVEYNPWDPFYPVYKNTLSVFCVLLAAITVDSKDSRWDIPILCFLASAYDPFFILHFFPTVFIMLLYRLDSKKFTKDYRLLFIFALIAALAGFVFFYENRIMLPTNLSVGVFFHHFWRLWLINLTKTLPLVLLFIVLWLKVLIRSKDTWSKFLLTIILLEPLIHLPALLFLENYNDFIMTTLFSWFILLASFFHAKDEKITKSLEDISSLLNRRPLLTGLALIYLATFATLKPNPTVISFLG